MLKRELIGLTLSLDQLYKKVGGVHQLCWGIPELVIVLQNVCFCIGYKYIKKRYKHIFALLLPFSFYLPLTPFL
jgi:hypothetical protein